MKLLRVFDSRTAPDFEEACW